MSVQTVATNDTTREQQKIAALLQDQNFAYEVAENQNNAYYTGIGETPTPLLENGDEKTTIAKTVKDEKIAMNLAALYALESCIHYLSALHHKLPSEILDSISKGTTSKEDKELFCRFANATWKAGQPFRALDRITRPVFVPFDMLSEEEKQKDWSQIQSAAELLLKKL